MKSNSIITKSKTANWYAPLKHPLQAVVVGLLLGGVIIALSGFNPFEAIIGMFKGGLGGVLLSMGTVTLFMQNMTSGRGYIAMAANNLGKSHPLGVLLSSLFFGFSQAAGNVLQNTSLKTQITASIPYVATIVALILFSLQTRRKKNK